MSIIAKIARAFRIDTKVKKDTKEPKSLDSRLKRFEVGTTQRARKRRDQRAYQEATDGAGLVLVVNWCWCDPNSPCKVPCDC